VGKIISFLLIIIVFKKNYAVLCDTGRENNPFFEKEKLSRFF